MNMMNDPNKFMNNNDPNQFMNMNNNNDPNQFINMNMNMNNNNDPNQFMNNNNNNQMNNNNNNDPGQNNAWPQMFNNQLYFDQQSLDAAILAYNQGPPQQGGQTFNAVDGVSQYYQGGTGDDTFIAGTGKDNFEGGGGADTFVFTLGEGSSNANPMLALSLIHI